MERQPPAFWWLRGVKLLQLRHAPSGTRECFDSKTEICKSTPCGLGVVRSGKQITGKYLVCVGVWASSSLLTIWWSSRLLNKIFSIPILLMCEYYRQDGLPCVHLSCPAPSFRPRLLWAVHLDSCLALSCNLGFFAHPMNLCSLLHSLGIVFPNSLCRSPSRFIEPPTILCSTEDMRRGKARFHFKSTAQKQGIWSCRSLLVFLLLLTPSCPFGTCCHSFSITYLPASLHIYPTFSLNYSA